MVLILMAVKSQLFFNILQVAVENCNVSALDNMFRTPLHWAAVLGKFFLYSVTICYQFDYTVYA